MRVVHYSAREDVMRLRKWVSVLAMLGVLLHAGALVQHNSAMLGKVLQHLALVSDLAQSCHGSGGEASDVAGLPHIPTPSDAQNGCPICSGLVSAVALASPWGGVIPLPAATSVDAFIAFASMAPLPRSAHPQARAPPALA